MSTISVWKRFSEVKELYKEIETKSKRLHLKGDFPLLKQTNFFNRFEAAIIEERKKFILDLLYFIAQHPALYSTKSFSDFLRVSSFVIFFGYFFKNNFCLLFAERALTKYITKT